jgi:hypothetical protein
MSAHLDPDVEARARAIELAARAGRKPLPRGVWIAALVVSVVSVAGLAIAWWQDHDTVSTTPLARHPSAEGGGMWVGVLVGLGVGIAIGSLFALKKK